jgi:hypothetical protein
MSNRKKTDYICDFYKYKHKSIRHLLRL